MEVGCLFQRLRLCPDGWAADEIVVKCTWGIQQQMQRKQATEGVPGEGGSMRVDRIAALNQRAQFLQ